MESAEIDRYIKESINIIKTNIGPIWVITALGLLSSINFLFPENIVSRIINSVCFFAVIIAKAIIFGFYYEITENKYSSIAEIAHNYILHYLFLVICMLIPGIILGFFLILLQIYIFPETNEIVIFEIIFLAFSLLYLYVVPIFYMTNKILSSIILGVIFIYKNLILSKKIILIALASNAILIISKLHMVWLLNLNKILYIIFAFGIYIATYTINFILFITMIFILRNKKQTNA